MAQPKLSLVDSGIIDAEAIEDALFEGEMMTAREEMRDGFVRMEMSVISIEKRLAVVETQLEDAAKKLQVVHDERTALRAMVRLVSWASGIVAVIAGAVWAVYTRWAE